MEIRTVVLDFDGTLAPIRRDPSAVRLPASMRRQLAVMVAAGLEVMVLSGRPYSFLKAQEFPKGVRLCGNFGNPSGRRQAGFGKGFLLALGRLAKIRGVEVERKAGYAVHYRKARQQDIEKVKKLVYIAADEAGDGASMLYGRKAVEILPAGVMPKEEFLSKLAGERNHGVLFIGDDPSDLAAMHALRKKGNFSCALVKSGEVDSGVGSWPAKLLNRRALERFLSRLARAQGRRNSHPG
ncbi:MAG: trehalose-phosphatase [Candidatus Micrarchaeia archaeon]